MLLTKNYVKKIMFFAAVIWGVFIGLIIMFEYREHYGDTKNTSYYDINDELIIIFNEMLNEEDIYMILNGYNYSVNIVKHWEDYALLSVSESSIYQEVIDYLDNHPSVKSVEVNGSLQLLQTTDDPYSSAQWPIHNPGYYSVFTDNRAKEVTATQDIDMDILEAWMLMNQGVTKSREVVVAIIDTGVDYTHPDLAQHIWINQNEIPGDGIDNDNNGYVDDVYGWDFYNDDASIGHYKYDRNTKLNLSLPEDNDDHGTHIAGIIAAEADNGIGIAGIASNIDVKLMILKINGGSNGTGSISDAILAIKYATRMGADICNISWGTTQYSPALKETIKESDMLFVAAAGNLGSNNDIKPVYPANFKLDNLISVTFIDSNGEPTRLSNYGKNSVEIAAPGTDIISTVVGTYKTLTGSSMAAPHVSAVAALLYSYDSNLYPWAVKNIIIKTLKPIIGLKDAILYPGIPNAYNAILEVDRIRGDYLPPTINTGTIYDKGDLIVNIKVDDSGGSGVRVVRWLTGIREIADFNRGTTGLSVRNEHINVSKAGIYTIYASDYAGNESIMIHEVEDDTKPPSITSSYSVSEDYNTRTVNIRIVDSQSGIRRVKYMPGNKKVTDFLPAGSGIEINLVNDRSSFNVARDGIYTLYAIDNRGNHIVKQINVKTILTEELKFTRSEKTMVVGEQYYLRAFIKPANSTDVISYTSSNERVALINSKGRLVALREGTATITARTNNGIRVVCRIVVIKRNS